MSRRREGLSRPGHRPLWLPLLVAALGVLAMGVGYGRGELYIYFTKAVNICLECIGIG